MEGPVGPTLVGRAIGAGALVVGSGAHHSLGRLLTGSMSLYCATHATCPVVVVPEHGKPLLSIRDSERGAGSSITRPPSPAANDRNQPAITDLEVV